MHVDGAHTFLVNTKAHCMAWSGMSVDEAPPSDYLVAVHICTAGFVYRLREVTQQWSIGILL